MPNQQLVRHTATVLRQWWEATNISASMKTFHCYDIDNSMVLMRHHWLDRQAALCKIAMKMCGPQQNFVRWKICQEASADMRGQQITLKPNCLKNFGKHMMDRFAFERTAETKGNTSVHNAAVIYIFHWSFLQLPTILMVSILDWITVCIVDVYRSYKTVSAF